MQTLLPAPPDTMLVFATRDKTRVSTILIPIIAFSFDPATQKFSAVPLIDPSEGLNPGTYLAAVVGQDGRVYDAKDGPRVFDTVDEWAATIRVKLGIKPDMTQDPPVDQVADRVTGDMPEGEVTRAPRQPATPLVGPPVGRPDGDGETPGTETPAEAAAPATRPRRRRADPKKPPSDAPAGEVDTDLADLV